MKLEDMDLYLMKYLDIFWRCGFVSNEIFE